MWVADNGDGTYKNPILNADYSDPDIIRVGTDYYMTASSFNAVPGLPILHSKDLVNWRIVGHAIRRLEPDEIFSKPQHGGGVWAPALRYHNGLFYIYYSDPDRGIYVTTAKAADGEWSEPKLVKGAKGWIDPCPLWDDDGSAYIVHAFAGSRAGVKSLLVVNRMSADGLTLLDGGTLVFDGHDQDPTVEGPKFYKLNGYYYILAPAGGVATGWQLALRSKNIYGPYQRHIILDQGKTAINGPHQGGLVDTPSGQWWFMHFQDKGPFGRVVHLQPAAWKNGFPVAGADPDGDGTGEPVDRWKKPNVGHSFPMETPPDSDEFNGVSLGQQWQWHANPGDNWAFMYPSGGVLKMMSVEQPPGYRNLSDAPNLLLQKLPGAAFVSEAKVRIRPRYEGERFGLVVMGLDYSYLGVTHRQGKLYISQFTATAADKGTAESESRPVLLASGDIRMVLRCSEDAACYFEYSGNGGGLRSVGTPFKAKEGRWIGAKVGFFFNRPGKFNDAGSAEIDWIRFRKAD